MNHPSEEQLVLFHYGDADDGLSIEQHLLECSGCRASFDALQQTYAAVESVPVPERGAGYGRDVWAQLEPRLDRGGWSWMEWFQPKRLALVGTMAALLIVAFVTGTWFEQRRNGTGSDVTGIGEPSAKAVQERVLIVAVGDHLERSQMVLVELVNTRPSGEISIATERRRAEELVASNRLYRQTAANLGDTGVETLLDELERTLVEIARSPEKISGPELASLQKRIEAKGILFKVRVVGSQLREQEKPAATEPARGRS